MRVIDDRTSMRRTRTLSRTDVTVITGIQREMEYQSEEPCIWSVTIWIKKGKKLFAWSCRECHQKEAEENGSLWLLPGRGMGGRGMESKGVKWPSFLLSRRVIFHFLMPHSASRAILYCFSLRNGVWAAEGNEDKCLLIWELELLFSLLPWVFPYCQDHYKTTPQQWTMLPIFTASLKSFFSHLLSACFNWWICSLSSVKFAAFNSDLMFIFCCSWAVMRGGISKNLSGIVMLYFMYWEQGYVCLQRRT